ncbi:DUF3267 domain-containing protein [Halobaculum magnesiiphilum]|uniref:DUF3267 domain-containing protein n=1 Tax=Halobaculum magnesiiphilum TaxID=1017351 RepID=A0A8T8WAX4_9EURY|nr:DUF3267 domain-containing protein [Halobaculum magnesiiphilum]QZP36987.1 DUF3267 domain-containing protein [Halobaculum magnesiiphilum]
MVTASSGDPETVLADLQLSRSLTIQWTVVGTMGFGVAVAAFGALYQLFTGEAVTFQFASADVAWWVGPMNVLAVAALATVILVPHEWLHGLAIRYYGGEPRYGVGLAHFILPYAYATTDHRFTRDQFLVVLLVPLIGITAVGVPLLIVFEWSWLVIPLAANAGGAVGDLWMSMTLLGYPSHVDVEDHRTGIRILGRETDRPRELSMTAVVWDALVGAAVTSVGILVALSFGGLFLLDALGVGSFTVGTPGTITYVVGYVNTPEEISVSVGLGVPALGGLIGLAYSFVRSYRRLGRSAGAGDA